MTPAHTTADGIVADAYFPALRDQIISATGLVFYADRPQSLARHIGERLTQRGLDDCRSYIKLLQDEHSGAAELDQLVELLTIGETYFFRHQELFDALRDTVLPEIIGLNRHSRRLRVWNAGCSNGAEAYSLAIVLRRDLGHLVQGWDISIVGTDINRTFLAQAAAGEFEEWAFRGTPPELRSECFQQQGTTWRVAKAFRDGVAFRYHNLATHPYPSPAHGLAAFDLILCRNVLIYFGPEFVQHVTSQLSDCLVADGWLAMGHADHGPDLSSAVEAVSFPGAIVYRKSRPRAAQPAGDRQCFLAEALARPNLSPAANSAESFRHGAHRGAAPRCVELATHTGVRNRTSAAGPPSELQRIRALADEGNIDAALDRCKAQVAKEPLNPIGHFYEALLLDLVGQDAAALRSLQKAVYLDRNFVVAHYYAGLIHEKLGHAHEALTSFGNVVTLLAGRSKTERLPDAGGLDIADLQELTRLRIAALEAI